MSSVTSDKPLPSPSPVSPLVGGRSQTRLLGGLHLWLPVVLGDALAAAHTCCSADVAEQCEAACSADHTDTERRAPSSQLVALENASPL